MLMLMIMRFKQNRGNGLLPFLISLTFLGVFFLPPSPLMAEDKLKRAGWIEEVRICPDAIRLDAKLDTGAKSASIHADNISKFTRDGEEWVQFDVTDHDGNPRTFKRKIQRTVFIKRHKQEPAKRPVILMGICLGNYFKVTEVNLADRSNYRYPVLIGRKFLADRFVIDSSSKHVLTPRCCPAGSPK